LFELFDDTKLFKFAFDNEDKLGGDDNKCWFLWWFGKCFRFWMFLLEDLKDEFVKNCSGEVLCCLKKSKIVRN